MFILRSQTHFTQNHGTQSRQAGTWRSCGPFPMPKGRLHLSWQSSVWPSTSVWTSVVVSTRSNLLHCLTLSFSPKSNPNLPGCHLNPLHPVCLNRRVFSSSLHHYFTCLRRIAMPPFSLLFETNKQNIKCKIFCRIWHSRFSTLHFLIDSTVLKQSAQNWRQYEACVLSRTRSLIARVFKLTYYFFETGLFIIFQEHYVCPSLHILTQLSSI